VLHPGGDILAATFRAMDALRVFDVIYATTTGGPADATMNLHLRAFFYAFQWYQMGMGMAYAMLYALMNLGGWFPTFAFLLRDHVDTKPLLIMILPAGVFCGGYSDGSVQLDRCAIQKECVVIDDDNMLWHTILSQKGLLSDPI
jgi:hypothetical protein